MELQGPYWPHSQGETWTLKGTSVALKGPQEHPKIPSIHIKNEVTQFTPPAAFKCENSEMELQGQYSTDSQAPSSSLKV